MRTRRWPSTPCCTHTTPNNQPSSRTAPNKTQIGGWGKGVFRRMVLLSTSEPLVFVPAVWCYRACETRVPWSSPPGQLFRKQSQELTTQGHVGQERAAH